MKKEKPVREMAGFSFYILENPKNKF